MKANELMIGDWVHVEVHRGFNAQNVKVETIPDNDGDNKYGHHYGHIGTWLDGGDNDFRDVEAKHLQPIPLTPEILEKNGFVEKEFYSELIVGNFRILCDLHNVCVYHNEHVDLDIPIEYLHELQHALKICRIEKEIEL